MCLETVCSFGSALKAEAASRRVPILLDSAVHHSGEPSLDLLHTCSLRVKVTDARTYVPVALAVQSACK
jgi:hypothetical protein